MAQPVIRLFDSLGVEIAAPIAIGQAVPGVPTAELTFTVRNNSGGGAVVDPALGVYLVGTARPAGSSGAFVSTGNAFADAAALQARVISFSGGATGQATGFRRSPLRLGDIPDGGQVQIGIRVVATAAAATSDWEVALALEVNPWIPLRDVGFEASGGFVYDGRGGGFSPDPDFTAVESVTGAFAAGTADDTIDLPSVLRYYLAGQVLTWEPVPATLVFDDEDGAAAALASGEYYWAGLTLDGAAVLTVTKGLKALLPAVDGDKPVLPADELALAWVVVPFGLAIDTIEVVYELGFFGQSQPGGLDVVIHPGIGASAGYWSRLETATEVTLADDATSTLWLLPGNALEITTAAGAYASERRSLPLWRFTAAAGVITSTEDLRQIGADVRASELYQVLFVVDAAAVGAQTVHIQLADRYGQPVAYRARVELYLADDAAGLVPSTVAPDGGLAAGADGVVLSADSLTGHVISEADGDVDLVVSESVSGTWYAVLVIDGRLYPSTAITPT